MSLQFWDEAFSTTVYLINRLPTMTLHGVSPLTKLFGVSPNYSMLSIFGCKYFPCLRPYNSHKLDFRSQPCTFLGYSMSHKGYHFLSSSGRIFISRHVIFYEYTFSFASPHTTSPKISTSIHMPSLSTHLPLKLFSPAPIPTNFYTASPYSSRQQQDCNLSYQYIIPELNTSSPTQCPISEPNISTPTHCALPEP